MGTKDRCDYSQLEPLIRPDHFPRRVPLTAGRRPVPTTPPLLVPQLKILPNTRLPPARPTRTRVKPRRVDTPPGVFGIKLGL
jgi:hypothetical protein